MTATNACERKTRKTKANKAYEFLGVIPGLTLLVVGCPRVVTCEGVCPAPGPGVQIDRGVVRKSVWATTSVAGPAAADPALCSVQVDATPDHELLFLGTGGTLLFRPSNGAPGQPLLMSGVIEFLVDLDQNGAFEYITTSPEHFRYYGEKAQLLFEGPPALSIWSDRSADFDADGVFELILINLPPTPQGVTLVNADGQIRASFGPSGVSHMRRAIAPDGSVVLVTNQTEQDESGFVHLTNFQTWSGHGVLLDHLDAQSVVRQQTGSIATAPAAEHSEFCFGQPVVEPFWTEGEVAVRWRDDALEIRVDGNPLVVDFSASFRVTSQFVLIHVEVRRTILTISEINGTAIYQEVFVPKTEPTINYYLPLFPQLPSFVVLPSNHPAQDVLLIAQDGQILSFAPP